MLLKVLMIYVLLKTRSQRGVVKTIEESPPLQAALGGTLTRNTLSNALQHRDLEQMLEAWQLVLTYYGPQVARLGKKFARVRGGRCQSDQIVARRLCVGAVPGDKWRGEDARRVGMGAADPAAVCLY